MCLVGDDVSYTAEPEWIERSERESARKKSTGIGNDEIVTRMLRPTSTGIEERLEAQDVVQAPVIEMQPFEPDVHDLRGFGCGIPFPPTPFELLCIERQRSEARRECG